MYSAKITKAEKIYVQADSSEMLAVDFDVIETRTVEQADLDHENVPADTKIGSEWSYIVAHYSHGFPLTTTKEDIEAYFKTFIETTTANKARSVANADRDAAHAVADETIASIVGIEIKN